MAIRGMFGEIIIRLMTVFESPNFSVLNHPQKSSVCKLKGVTEETHGLRQTDEHEQSISSGAV